MNELAQNVLADLKVDEGFRGLVYDDATGKPIVPGTLVKGHPTIGIGRALDVNGITQAEGDYLCLNSIQESIKALEGKLDWFPALDATRKRVLINMCYNMGIAKLLSFRNFLAAVKAGNYNAAAIEMKNSAWWGQVGARADRLAKLILS